MDEVADRKATNEVRPTTVARSDIHTAAAGVRAVPIAPSMDACMEIPAPLRMARAMYSTCIIAAPFLSGRPPASSFASR